MASPREKETYRPSLAGNLAIFERFGMETKARKINRTGAVIYNLMNQTNRSSFFASRWRGETSLQRLLWRDMIYVGTLINLAAGFTGLIMLIQNVAPVFALAAHLAPVPYNIFLLLSVRRSKQGTQFASMVAGLWFLLMLII